jgi:hypothetical protein
MRKLGYAIVVASLALAVPVAVLAANGEGGGLAEVQSYRFTTGTQVATAGFRGVSGLSEVAFCARKAVVADLSVRLRDAPAEFRVTVTTEGGPTRVMRPGVVRLDPDGGREAFSFTFVATVFANDQTVNVEWRRSGPVPATLAGGSLVVTFESTEVNCDPV